MDILIWLTGKRARFVSSYGNNYLFRKEMAPDGAASRCMNCTIRKDCPYDAVRYYLEDERTSVNAGRTRWIQHLKRSKKRFSPVPTDAVYITVTMMS